MEGERAKESMCVRVCVHVHVCIDGILSFFVLSVHCSFTSAR